MASVNNDLWAARLVVGTLNDIRSAPCNKWHRDWAYKGSIVG